MRRRMDARVESSVSSCWRVKGERAKKYAGRVAMVSSRIRSFALAESVPLFRRERPRVRILCCRAVRVGRQSRRRLS